MQHAVAADTIGQTFGLVDIDCCASVTRPVGRPPNHVRRYYASFSYRAKSWDKVRRVVAKVNGIQENCTPASASTSPT